MLFNIIVDYPSFLAFSSIADKLSKINSHISPNKVWIISAIEGREGGGGGKGGMEAVVFGRGPHPTTTLPFPLHLDNLFHHLIHINMENTHHTFRAGTQAEKKQCPGIRTDLINEHWQGWFCQSIFYLNWSPAFSPQANILPTARLVTQRKLFESIPCDISDTFLFRRHISVLMMETSADWHPGQAGWHQTRAILLGWCWHFQNNSLKHGVNW